MFSMPHAVIMLAVEAARELKASRSPLMWELFEIKDDKASLSQCCKKRKRHEAQCTPYRSVATNESAMRLSVL